MVDRTDWDRIDATREKMLEDAITEDPGADNEDSARVGFGYLDEIMDVGTHVLPAATLQWANNTTPMRHCTSKLRF